MQSKQQFYDDYHKKNHFFSKVIKENNFTYYYTLKFLREIISSLPKDARILDIGCGVGTLALYMAIKGFEVDGYDVSKDAIEIAKDAATQIGIRNTHFYNKDVQVAKTQSRYDLIICTEVIEHLEFDQTMLIKIHDLLKEGGFLILSTPSVNAPLYRLGLLRDFDRQVGHLRRYSLESLSKLIRKSKLKLLELRGIEGLPRNFLFTIKPFGQLIRVIRGPFIGIFHMIDEFFVYCFGESNFILIAQKK